MKNNEVVIDICPLIRADVLEVKNLEQECELSPWSINDYFGEAGRKDSLSFVAKYENKIAGFIIARPITTDEPNKFDLEIFNIGVAKNFRRCGIGEKLVHKVTRETKNISNANPVITIWIEVRESNKRAISFYQALGFKTTGVRNNFYRNPTENGLIMRRTA